MYSTHLVNTHYKFSLYFFLQILFLVSSYKKNFLSFFIKKLFHKFYFFELENEFFDIISKIFCFFKISILNFFDFSLFQFENHCKFENYSIKTYNITYKV
jgi:hypothetical protein